MKFRVTMKDPDTLHEAIVDAAEKSSKEIAGLTALERDEVAAIRGEEAAVICAQWFKYGEYLTVEIDTEAGTAVVCDAER